MPKIPNYPDPVHALIDLLADRIAERLRAAGSGQAQPAEPIRYHSKKQEAERLGCTTQHLDRLHHEGLPCVLIGKHRRYIPAEVDAWLATRRPERPEPKPPPDPLEAMGIRRIGGQR